MYRYATILAAWTTALPLLVVTAVLVALNLNT